MAFEKLTCRVVPQVLVSFSQIIFNNLYILNYGLREFNNGFTEIYFPLHLLSVQNVKFMYKLSIQDIIFLMRRMSMLLCIFATKQRYNAIYRAVYEYSIIYKWNII